MEHVEIKRIGDTGQISVGKALAGKLVRVEAVAEGVMLRFVVDVPEKDAWWTQEPHKTALKKALVWAAANPAKETDLVGLMEQIGPKASSKPVSRKKRTAKR